MERTIKETLLSICNEVGTPVYAYGMNTIKNRIGLLRRSLPEKVKIFYSMKANPNLGIVSFIKQYADGIEVSSEGELFTALKAGIRPENIIFSGPGKTSGEIAYAMENSIGYITAESERELILNDSSVINRLKDLKQICDEVYLTPYAITSKEMEISAITGCKIVGPRPEVARQTNNKVNARLLAIEVGLPVTEGFVCRSIDEIQAAINQLKKSGCGKIVLKDAYGASGKGLYMIDSEKSAEIFLNQVLLRKRKSKNNIEVIVERWYDTKIDINYQVFIRNDGTIVFIPPKRQILSGVIYKGSEFPIDNILSKRQMEIYNDAAGLIGKKLYDGGYRGIASIDSIIAKDDAVFPMVEINGRFSLSTYISFVPALLGHTKFFASKYYDVYSDAVASEIQEWLWGNNYTPEKDEGLIVYTFAGKSGTVPGRIFIVYAYHELCKLHAIEKHVNSLFNPAVT